MMMRTLVESNPVCEQFTLSKSCAIPEQADLVYTQTYGASDVLDQIRYCSRPFVIHMGGDIWYELRTIAPQRLRIIESVLKRAMVIVANSRFLYGLIRSHGYKNVIFLPGGLWGFDHTVHGVSPKRIYVKKNYAQSGPISMLMSISIQVRKKYLGIQKFMEIAHPFLKSINAKIICAGTVNEKNFARQMSKFYGVEFIGHRNDWGELLSSADIFLHPSLFDCFPRALAEAKCAGIPSLAFGVTGNVEVGDSPVFCDPKNPEEIVTSLENLCRDVELREYLGRLSNANATKKTERHRADYSYILKDLVTEGPARLIHESEVTYYDSIGDGRSGFYRFTSDKTFAG